MPIGPDVDLATLREELVTAGCALLVASLAHGAAGLPVPVPQSGEPTIAAKVTPDDLRLQWAEPAVQLHRVVRLGRAWTTFRGKRLGVLRATPVVGPPGDAEPADAGPAAEVGPRAGRGRGRRARWWEPSCAPVHGGLALEEVQPESRAPMPAGDWARGVRLLAGERLGSD